jgi:hypothetical protein
MGGRGSGGGGASAATRSGSKPAISIVDGLVYRTLFDSDGGITTAVKPGQGQLGTLTWLKDGRIGDIHVTASAQGKGIGSEMWRQAQQATGGKLRHHANRTDAGEAFARKVGGHIPPRSGFR